LLTGRSSNPPGCFGRHGGCGSEPWWTRVCCIHDGKTDPFTPPTLSGGAVSSLLEDFEGNIWARPWMDSTVFATAIPTISVQQGLSSRGVDAILAASDGSVWLGASNGLNRWNQGLITIYRNRSMRGGRAGAPFGGPGARRAARTGATVRGITDPGLPEGAVICCLRTNRDFG
jgi:ligand-binding sensor domain-containing protein